MALSREILLQSRHWIYIGNVGRVSLRVITGGLPHQTVHLPVRGLLMSGVSATTASCTTTSVVGVIRVFARFVSLNLKSLHYVPKLAGDSIQDEDMATTVYELLS